MYTKKNYIYFIFIPVRFVFTSRNKLSQFYENLMKNKKKGQYSFQHSFYIVFIERFIKFYGVAVWVGLINNVFFFLIYNQFYK